MGSFPTPVHTRRPASSVLLVEDETDILASLKSFLETYLEDAVIRTATSGPAALKALREGPADLIITDYRMPDMDGLEFLRQSLPLAPDANRIMITAFPKLELAIQAINEVHVDKFMTKPFPPDDLLDAARVLLAARTQGSARRPMARAKA